MAEVSCLLTNILNRANLFIRLCILNPLSVGAKLATWAENEYKNLVQWIFKRIYAKIYPHFKLTCSWRCTPTTRKELIHSTMIHRFSPNSSLNFQKSFASTNIFYLQSLNHEIQVNYLQLHFKIKKNYE